MIILLERVCKNLFVGTTLHVVSKHVKLCFIGGSGSQNFDYENQKNLSEENEAHKDKHFITNICIAYTACMHFKTVYFQNSCWLENGLGLCQFKHKQY